MMEDTCPHCHSDLTGAPIPEHEQHLFGGATHFSRWIGHYDQTLDRTVAYYCPDCGERWGDGYMQRIREAGL